MLIFDSILFSSSVTDTFRNYILANFKLAFEALHGFCFRFCDVVLSGHITGVGHVTGPSKVLTTIPISGILQVYVYLIHDAVSYPVICDSNSEVLPTYQI